MSDTFLQLKINDRALPIDNQSGAPTEGGTVTFRNVGNSAAFYKRDQTRPVRSDRVGIPVLPGESGEIRTAPIGRRLTIGHVETDLSEYWTGAVGRWWFWTEPGDETTLVFYWPSRF